MKNGVDGRVMFSVELKSIRICLYLFCVLALGGCLKEWHCKIDGDSMYSISDSGDIGGAENGCTCEEIARFERRFGEVDYEALSSDFGC